MNRYDQKAWGIYLVISKNYNLLGNLGFHGGLSKNSWENDYDNDGQTNLFFGLDAWTAYELSWLDVGGIPKNGVLYASYKSSSERFIESKSLKLYLNSINNKKFDTPKDLLALIKSDLEQCISDDVDIEIRNSPKKFIQEGKSSDLLKSFPKLQPEKYNVFGLEKKHEANFSLRTMQF